MFNKISGIVGLGPKMLFVVLFGISKDQIGNLHKPKEFDNIPLHLTNKSMKLVSTGYGLGTDLPQLVL